MPSADMFTIGGSRGTSSEHMNNHHWCECTWDKVVIVPAVPGNTTYNLSALL